MGCCFSDNNSESSPEDDPTTRLLQNPVRDGPANAPMRSQAQTAPEQHKGDEQSALNRILHQTASDVIDVAALESQAMEQHEYLERARQYSARLAIACGGSQKSRSNTHLPAGVAAPQVILASQPISVADIQLVTNAAQQAAQAVKEIKVKHKEDLVVPFGVP